MAMHQPLAVPDVEARAQVRKHIHPVRLLDSGMVVRSVDRFFAEDVAAEIEKNDPVAGHC